MKFKVTENENISTVFLNGEIERVKMIKINVHSPKWLIILSTGSGHNSLKII